MNDQKDLLEQFMHHNMPEKSIDPDASVCSYLSGSAR